MTNAPPAYESAPFGDPTVVADLGTSDAELLALCAHEGTLPVDLIVAVCERPAARRRSKPSGCEFLADPLGRTGRASASRDGAALAVAREALPSGDVPIGAVVLDRVGAVIASAHNERERTNDPTAHAELVALRRAGAALGSWQLVGCTLVVTLEPCTMCAGAIVLSRVDRLVFGAWDPKAGAVGSLLGRRPRPAAEPSPGGPSLGVLEPSRCGAAPRADFFAQRR